MMAVNIGLPIGIVSGSYVKKILRSKMMMIIIIIAAIMMMMTLNITVMVRSNPGLIIEQALL